jgi:NADH:ubiquinone oxidoreductase subunit 2 (subunit N)
MLLGNIAAVMQNNVMRILAYSTIAQAGYIVIGVAAYGATSNSEIQSAAMAGILIHVIAHVLMKGAVLIATFVIIDNFGSSDIIKFKGLFHKHPVFAATLAIGLFSLMGIPPTLGFTGKFFLFYSAVVADMMWLAIIGVIGSAISIYYYGRIMRIMTEKPDEDVGEVRVFLPILILLILMSVLTLVLSIFTEQIVDLATSIASELP